MSVREKKQLIIAISGSSSSGEVVVVVVAVASEQSIKSQYMEHKWNLTIRTIRLFPARSSEMNSMFVEAE